MSIAFKKPLLCCATLLATTGAAHAFERVYGEHGELADIGRVLYEGIPPLGRLSCEHPPTLTRTGNEFTVDALVLHGPANFNKPCEYLAQFDFGLLPAGNYAVTTKYTGELSQTTKLTFRVDAAAQACTNDPRITEVHADHPTKDAAALLEELKDPAKRALLGNPTKVQSNGITGVSGYKASIFTYPAPVNLTPKIAQLKGQGFHQVFKRNYPLFCGGFAYMYSVKSTVTEYYNTILDHYFYTGKGVEAGYIDAGHAGPGWTRTGQTFPIVLEPGCDTPLDAPDQQPLLRPVFRFYGTPGKGPNSHFFTVDRGECHIVTKDEGWQYEGLPFWATPVRDGGTCPANGTQPLYRLYNNRAAQNDSNHRYTTKQAIVDEMVAKGWIKEGVAMCVMI